ncbi:aldehyde dehydrogenase (NADP(+)) [Nocardia sp. CDC159]|uniref:Aldehyde dehydrogenase (NADP(+)) n=1 Tax=Nocardia pulmonis TaxID=2951408 RepID=A0A9X2IY51_9NOCA|nr:MULTISPECIES: aldehyde dehydrogenase (NADP(+)) [Nocardia]MCM6774595.1 aldehyde dehydrogenase (NADP(+)) [Nocardia pulmonis]MCM6787340.1 aldehyde dehydrogenase (NADP(+)) [Nocardia sp. CDC159]
MSDSVIEAETTDRSVDAVVAAAAAAPWAELDLADRARVLRGIADRLDGHRAELVAQAAAETALSEQRLTGELRRTSFQLRLFARIVLDRDFLDVRIDPPDPDWPMGAPRPDLRRINVPLGPVLNFAASNFPFAFSVAGGDTASALAAGCPVIVKANPGHPLLSRRVGELVAAALGEVGAPAGTFGLIFGRAAGVRALLHPAVAAATFTGSTAGGRALYDLACRRPVPIPFFGELGSINPVFVTAEAAHRRAAEIAAGLAAVVSSSAGQLCTKPGLIAIPADARLADELADLMHRSPAPTGPMLNDDIAAGFAAAVERVRSHPEVRVLAGGGPGTALLLATTARAVLAEPAALLHEMFGPATLLAEYRDTAELLALARSIGGQLTVSIFGERADDTARALLAAATAAAGRVLWNDWPTGVSVTYAQQHGGPYPATTAPASTSVGAAAISRFLRPVVYQQVPDDLLPPELRTGNPLAVPRSVNGARPR